MIFTLPPLYGIAAGLIISMAGFAWNNRRMGWRKDRKSVVQDLVSLQTMWEEDNSLVSGLESQGKPVVPRAPVDESEFSTQLSSLQKSLGRSAKVTTPAAAEQRVPV